MGLDGRELGGPGTAASWGSVADTSNFRLVTDCARVGLCTVWLASRGCKHIRLGAHPGNELVRSLHIHVCTTLTLAGMRGHAQSALRAAD